MLNYIVVFIGGLIVIFGPFDVGIRYFNLILGLAIMAFGPAAVKYLFKR